jgi:FKBP-type peptidyl-prolyl cis-trans isomerase
MKKSKTGLRYEIYHNGNGQKARKGMDATITYSAYLLDGTKIAGTQEGGSRTFVIGRDEIISGIHEGITYLQTGDSARFVIPSYLAYGLTGDKKVPSNAALYYDLCLVGLR